MKADFPVVFRILLLISLTTGAFGQGWVKHYPDDFGATVGIDAKPTADGGFILLSEVDFPTGAIRRYIRLTKADAEGNTQWEKIYNEGEIQDVQAADVWPVEGGYAVGYSQNGVLSFMLTDLYGDTVLTRQYPEAITSNCFAMNPTPDGGFVMGGIYTPDFSPSSATILKLDGQGNLQWWKDIPGSAAIHGPYTGEWDLKPTADGGYIITGTINTQLIWTKLDANADLVWSKSLQGSPAIHGYSIIETAAGGYLIGAAADGLSGPWPFLVRTDTDGEVLWQKAEPCTCLVSDLIEAGDGNYIAVGSLGSFYSNLGAPLIDKYGDNGALIWSSVLSDDPSHPWSFAGVYPDGNGGFILAGADGYEAMMVRINGQGRYNPHLLQGHVALDDDCIIDDQSTPLSGWVVEIENNEGTVYATTNELGYYEVSLDTGQYQVTAVLPSPYYGFGSCPGSVSVSLSTVNDSTTVDFPVAVFQECPYLSVDISTSILRRCFPSIYSVHYSNQGTVPSENTEIRVVLDPFMTVQSASLPYQTSGDTLIFELGALGVNQGGFFTVTVLVGCDNVSIGQTHCTSATISASNLCPPTGNDTPSVSVTGACDGENVTFQLKNNGPGLIQDAQFIVVEDDVMLAPTMYNLAEGQEKDYLFPANGSTWRLETPLFPNAFDGQFVSAVLEGCGTNDAGTFSTGFVNQFSVDGNSESSDTDCSQNVGSYDPNDKTAFPEGYKSDNEIYPNLPIEYLIRFQNTGTDTAFRVVVIDTLSKYLDPATIQPGASSHPYRFELYGPGIARFTFDPIALPDSTANEPASRGFVKFTIAQRPDLPEGTRIENQAGIYFDYNAPVLTNTTFHTVWDYLNSPNSAVESPSKMIALLLVPNPVSRTAGLSIQGADIESGELVLYDGFGKMVTVQPIRSNRAELNVQYLPAGLYFFRARSGGRWVGAGKVAVQ
ncbi:MAG: T9SS type A sorting domain-containing protein [Lewinellaceae bacterium]|nr:T9SS type A sorting domain-containing protein [Lewinellaceae bacterium]